MARFHDLCRLLLSRLLHQGGPRWRRRGPGERPYARIDRRPTDPWSATPRPGQSPPDTRAPPGHRSPDASPTARKCLMAKRSSGSRTATAFRGRHASPVRLLTRTSSIRRVACCRAVSRRAGWPSRRTATFKCRRRRARAGTDKSDPDRPNQGSGPGARPGNDAGTRISERGQRERPLANPGIVAVTKGDAPCGRRWYYAI